MPRRAEKIVCRASWRDPISANFSRVSFSTASHGFHKSSVHTFSVDDSAGMIWSRGRHLSSLLQHCSDPSCLPKVIDCSNPTMTAGDPFHM